MRAMVLRGFRKALYALYARRARRAGHPQVFLARPWAVPFADSGRSPRMDYRRVETRDSRGASAVRESRLPGNSIRQSRSLRLRRGTSLSRIAKTTVCARLTSSQLASLTEAQSTSQSRRLLAWSDAARIHGQDARSFPTRQDGANRIGAAYAARLRWDFALRPRLKTYGSLVRSTLRGVERKRLCADGSEPTRRTRGLLISRPVFAWRPREPSVRRLSSTRLIRTKDLPPRCSARRKS